LGGDTDTAREAHQQEQSGRYPRAILPGYGPVIDEEVVEGGRKRTCTMEEKAVIGRIARVAEYRAERGPARV